MNKHWKHFKRVITNSTLAMVAMARFGVPQRNMRLVAITGTDGKTTTSQMLATILAQDGRKVGVISTVGASINGRVLPLSAHVSTPGPWQIYALLRDMRRVGVTEVVIETTSHGLDQRRAYGLRFTLGIITNISAEHLDYHGTIEKYAATKARLCRLCQVMVLNGDDERVLAMVKLAKKAVLFGQGEGNDIRAIDSKAVVNGVDFSLEMGQEIKVRLPMEGQYNVMNALAASGAAGQLGLSLEQIAHGLSQVKGVAGRWQIVQDQPYLVVVDFGHTPQALQQVLPLARQHVVAGGRLIHVFGCAGGRDASKRRVMGELSGQLADMSVVTMEDPRHEILDAIQAPIIEGLQSVGKEENVGWTRIDNRQQAIAWAIGQAKSGDVILLTGKGHETSMNIGGVEVPWNEIAEVEKILKK